MNNPSDAMIKEPSMPRPATAPQSRRERPVGRPPLSSSDTRFLAQVTAAVKAAMDRGEVSVAGVAARMGLGVQSFRRRLLKRARQTPKAFFTAIQMERATRLLLTHPEMPVAKVASLSGYDNGSSFGHAFRRVYGCSPSRYREKEADAGGTDAS